MSEAKYGEPWSVYIGTVAGRGVERPFIQGADGQGEFDRIICGYDEKADPALDLEDVHLRMKRAAKCVNALAGIDSPSEWREAVGALREIAQRIHDQSAPIYAEGKIESFDLPYDLMLQLEAALERVEAGE